MSPIEEKFSYATCTAVGTAGGRTFPASVSVMPICAAHVNTQAPNMRRVNSEFHLECKLCLDIDGVGDILEVAT